MVKESSGLGPKILTSSSLVTLLPGVLEKNSSQVTHSILGLVDLGFTFHFDGHHWSISLPTHGTVVPVVFCSCSVPIEARPADHVATICHNRVCEAGVLAYWTPRELNTDRVHFLLLQFISGFFYLNLLLWEKNPELVLIHQMRGRWAPRKRFGKHARELEHLKTRWIQLYQTSKNVGALW